MWYVLCKKASESSDHLFLESDHLLLECDFSKDALQIILEV